MKEIARLFIIIIVFMVIIFPFVVRIEVDIIHYQNHKPNIRIMISDILKIKLDYEVTYNLIKRKSLKEIKYLITKSIYLTKKYDYLIRKILKEIKITKLSIVTSYLNENPITDSYLKFINLMIFKLIDFYLNNYFKDIKDDYYRIINRNSNEKIKYQIRFSIRGYQIIKVMTCNFPKIKELKKEF